MLPRLTCVDHLLQSRRNLNGSQIPSMNPLDEAAKESTAHNGPVSSARDDYAIASPLQVVVDTQEGMLLYNAVIHLLNVSSFAFLQATTGNDCLATFSHWSVSDFRLSMRSDSCLQGSSYANHYTRLQQVTLATVVACCAFTLWHIIRQATKYIFLLQAWAVSAVSMTSYILTATFTW